MKVPFNILDFLDRAEHVYGDRVGVVDEPDQPADSWGRMTWRQVAEHARAMAAGLDALGVGHGERIAIVSHNSARLLVALFAVAGYGRVVVPINFRLNADEVRYIIEQSGASASSSIPSSTKRSPTSTRPTGSRSAASRTQHCCASTGNRIRGSTPARTPSPRSTTPAAPQPDRRVSS